MCVVLINITCNSPSLIESDCRFDPIDFLHSFIGVEYVTAFDDHLSLNGFLATRTPL